MSLSERLRQLIEIVTPPTRRFIALEEATKIKAETWRTWWNRGGKASADMIQGIGAAWPEYAFWLVTGTPDLPHGHRAPTTDKAVLTRDAAKKLFLKQLEVQKWREENSWGAEEHECDYWDSDRKQYTDDRAKEFSELSRVLAMLEAIRDDQEKTFAKLEAAARVDAQRSRQAK